MELMLPRESQIKSALTSSWAVQVYLWFAYSVFTLSSIAAVKSFTASEAVMILVRALAKALPPAYMHFILLERFFFKKRFGLYLVLLVVNVVGYAYLYRMFSTVVFGKSYHISTIILNIILLLGASSALKLGREAITQRLLFHEVRAKQTQMELDLLKAQIHPHFLFNTLNNLFGLALKRDSSAADGIAKLAHLLRYMVYESNASLVDLEIEVLQIQRLIELEKLRFSTGDSIAITFEVEGDPHLARISPMLLLPFVENAFKHGICLSRPSFVRVILKTKPGLVKFSVENSDHSLVHQGSGDSRGHGHPNIKRRLELLYPNHHRLEIDASGGLYRVMLQLEQV